MNHLELIERLEHLAESLEGCEWNHPIMAVETCNTAINTIRNLVVYHEQWKLLFEERQQIRDVVPGCLDEYAPELLDCVKAVVNERDALRKSCIEVRDNGIQFEHGDEVGVMIPRSVWMAVIDAIERRAL